jgi:hypothetical protein
VLKPACVGQFEGESSFGGELHAAGRADRRELAVVAGEQQRRRGCWVMRWMAAGLAIADSSTTTMSPVSSCQARWSGWVLPGETLLDAEPAGATG